MRTYPRLNIAGTSKLNLYLRHLLSLAWILSSILSSAYIIEGKITNLEGNGIPYATIQAQGTKYGTYSFVSGDFSLEIPAGQYVLEVKSLGYQTATVAISVSENKRNQVITLTSKSTDIQEIIIGPDKAKLTRYILTKAKETRKKRAENLTSYKANAYAKYSLSYAKATTQVGSDSITTFSEKDEPELVESYGTVFYTSPDNHKEVIEAYRDYSYTSVGDGTERAVSFSATIPGGRETAYGTETFVPKGPNPYLFIIDKQKSNFDIYQNVLDVPDFTATPIVSPIGNQNFLVYNFYLEESFFEGDKKYYRITVTPKNALANALSGEMIIEDRSFRITQARLEVNEKSLLFYDHFSFKLNYDVQNDIPVLDREEYIYHTKDGKNKYAYGVSTLAYDGIELNIAISPKFMRKGVSLLTDSAKFKGQDFWEAVRPVGLKEREMKFITTQDSVREWESSIEFLERKDSIINHTDIWDVTLNGMQFINRKKGTNYYLGSLIQSIRPFQVGGYRQALVGSYSKKYSSANRLTVSGEINYGFRNRSLKGFGNVSYTFLPKKFGSFRIRGGDNFAILNNYESIQGTFSRSNYLQKLFYGVGASYELWNGVMLRGDLDYATFRSIDNVILAPWSERMFGELNIPKDFSGYQQLVADFILTIVPFQKYEITEREKSILGSDWPSFNIIYKKGIKPFGGSDVNYDFLELNVRQDLSLSTLGESKFEVYTGKFINDREIRIADNKFFRGSDRYFFSDPLRSFQYLGPTLNTTNAYFQGHYLHQFNGAIMNKVPLIKKLKLTSLAGAGALLLDDNNYRHTEIYAGLSKSFRIRTQLFKVTAVYVQSENSLTGLDGGVKIGFDFYNSYTKEWSY